MKAIQVKQVGGPDAMELVDLPVPQPKSHEALVKIAAAGVNFIDVYIREGRYHAPVPFVVGQEGSGVVTAVGADVKSAKVGNRVAWSGALGSYAEYVAAPAAALVPIPEDVGDRDAAGAMLQGMTAPYLCYDTYPLTPGKTALIHAGAGGVGLLLIQMAHNLGARVITTVSTEEKAKLAREAGADEVTTGTRSSESPPQPKLPRPWPRPAAAPGHARAILPRASNPRSDRLELPGASGRGRGRLPRAPR